jgi:hypothetical protein
MPDMENGGMAAMPYQKHLFEEANANAEMRATDEAERRMGA